MLYERKIRYLDYYEGGMRVKGGGFAKLEVRDGSLRIELAVTGLHHTDTFVREVMLCGRGREKSAGRIEIAAGKGQFKQLWRNLENIGDTGIGYGELTGIRIPLGAGRELSGRWQEAGAGAQPGSGKAAGDRMGMAKAREEVYEISLEHRDTGEQRGLEEKDQENDKNLEERRLEEKGQEKGMAQEEDALEEKTPEKEVLEEAAKRQGWTVTDGFLLDSTEDGQVREQFDPGGKTDNAPKREDAGGQADSEKGSGDSRNSGPEPTMRRRTAGSHAGTGTERNRQAEAERVRGTFSAGRGDRSRIVNDKRAGQDHAQTPFGATDAAGGAIAGSDTAGGPSPGPDIAQASLDRERPVKGSMEWKDTDAQPSRRKSPGEQEKEPVRLMEDKWPQLWAIYPHIRPFQDEREYLSIGPSDFVLFPESSYRAVNNSFLLHGYYNYRHLILGRMERKGESCYYIGVPGNFYEREKQVAIMFGFESFECAEEPAQAGDFGYYMMRIWI